MKRLCKKIDEQLVECNEFFQKRKKLFQEWIKTECDFKFPNWTKVLLAALISFLIFRFFYELQMKFLKSSNTPPISFWTLATLLISSPVAFIIWYFRDQNVKEQIENQRKDINLKEFQKIAEWVSGLHLVENEITEKETKESDDIKSETTTKYSLPDENRSIATFSKSDGAVGLQIAAIHSLLPFFRGEHGEGFRRPALNLLTSAWLSLQQKDLLELEKLDILKQIDEFEAQIEKIKKRANSPVGVALTQVLLSDGGDNLLKFPEVFPNLCLAGMNFHLPGLEQDVLSLFKQAKQCQGINLIGANLERACLEETNLMKSKLSGTNLQKAHLEKINLTGAYLYGANLSLAYLEHAILGVSHLEKIDLSGAHLEKSNLMWAFLELANLCQANLYGSDLRGANFDSTDLRGADLRCVDLQFTHTVRANLEGAVVYYNSEKLEEVRSQGKAARDNRT